jgi:tetratricopeptide (TPR) repeat protein
MDMPGGNIAMEHFIQEAYAQDIPVETINYPEGVHAFDIFQPGEKSEDIIKRTVKFFADNLQRPSREPAFVITNRNFVWLMSHGQSERALSEFRKMIVRCKTDSVYRFRYRATMREQSINANAYLLLELQKKQEALETFKLMVENYPESANAYDGLADAYEALGNKAEAVANAKKALAMLETSKDIDPEFKRAIEQSANEKLARLK